MDMGFLILRLVLGGVFLAHGTQKSFGWFGGQGIGGLAKFFEQLGFRPPRVHAVLAGAAEILSGVLLATGFLTPLGAALAISVMFVAAVGVHLPKGFFAHLGGYEYNLVLGAAAWALAFTGPGAFSVDSYFGFVGSGIGWGILSLVVGLLGGAWPLLSRSDKSVAQALKAS